jgi:hypothetical protein
LELQFSTQIAALNGQRARYLQSVNAALTAVGQHKSATESKLQELQVRAAEASRRVSARAGPAVAPPPTSAAATAGVPARSGAPLPPMPVASSAPPAPMALAPPFLHGSGGAASATHYSVSSGSSYKQAGGAPLVAEAHPAHYGADVLPSPASYRLPLPSMSTTPHYLSQVAASGSARMSLSTGASGGGYREAPSSGGTISRAAATSNGPLAGAYVARALDM